MGELKILKFKILFLSKNLFTRFFLFKIRTLKFRNNSEFSIASAREFRKTGYNKDTKKQ